MKVYLASSSPRRRESLENLGVEFQVVRPEADESSDITEPGELTELLSRRKAEAVADICRDGLVIACDTVVCVDDVILGKPADRAEAQGMLRRLSGRAHRVVSGICLICGDKCVTAHEVTRVIFDEMSDSDIEKCVELGEPYDKAGGYAVQGTASLYIRGLEGDYFNVVGLPVNLLRRTLKNEMGIDLV